MKKTKTKVILVKISFLNRVKQILGKANNPVVVFVVTLFLGIGIAVVLGYLYSNYNDKIFATDDSIRDTLNYQGKIVNADGVPPPDGEYKMQFKIFNVIESVDDANLLWTEVWDGSDQNDELADIQGMLVPVSQGVFTVELNSLCANWVGNCAYGQSGGVTFSQSSYYLQVELDYDGNGTYEEKFVPRKRFTSTPYSMNADKLDGKESADFVSKTGDHVMAGSLTAKGFIDTSAIAYYQFNDNVKNSSTYAGLDGSLQGNASLGSDMLFLDGVDSHVMVNDNINLSFGNGTLDSAFTFSAWINMNNAVNFPVISKGVYNTDAEYFFGTDIDGKLTVRIYDESVADCYIGRRFSAYSLSSGSWTHVSATYNGNGTAAGLKLYLNGELVDDADSSVTCSYVAMENLASAVYLGKYDANYANGKVDEVMIQNRTLTPAEVRSLYSTSRIKYLDVDEVTTLYLYLSGVDPIDQTNEMGYLYFDPVFNRLMISDQIFIPESFPALDNTKNTQDYTHFVDENKIVAYDFGMPLEGVIDLDGADDNGSALNNTNFTNTGFIGYGILVGKNGDGVSIDTPAISTDTGTIEMWSKLNNVGTSETNTLVHFYFSDSGTPLVQLVKQGTSDLYAKVGDATLTDTTYDIPDTNWHHYALTWNLGAFEVFVDGVSVATGAYTSPLTTPNTFLLGYGNAIDTSLNGSMDSVAIYTDVLTDDEIINHAQSAFNVLYINDKLNDGITETTLGNLISIPSFNNDNNPNDPVNFQYTGSRLLTFGFTEGSSDKTYSKDNNWDGNMYATIHGATWIKSGLFGHGMSFDGIDDYLEIAKIPYDDRYEFGTNDFAIEFWINGSSLGNNDKKVISKRVGDVGYEIYYDSSSDSLRFFIGDGTNIVNSVATGSHFSDGLWHHFLVSFDRDGVASIFRDGNIFDASPVDISSVSGSLTNEANLLIGKDSTGNYFNGKIDSIIFYDLNGASQFNFFDAFARVNKSSDFLFTIGKNTPNGIGTFSVINQSDNGHGAIIGMKNPNNTSNYPLAIWTDNNSSDIYNLIYFGSTILPALSSTEYGNLKWDNANNKFLLSDSISVTGNIEASGAVIGNLRSTGTAPTNATDSCTVGDIRYDSDYIYICIATDTWERAETATWP
jgi:hypothetical protein